MRSRIRAMWSYFGNLSPYILMYLLSLGQKVRDKERFYHLIFSFRGEKSSGIQSNELFDFHTSWTSLTSQASRTTYSRLSWPHGWPSKPWFSWLNDAYKEAYTTFLATILLSQCNGKLSCAATSRRLSSQKHLGTALFCSAWSPNKCFAKKLKE